MKNASQPIFKELPKKIKNNFYYNFKTKFFSQFDSLRKSTFVGTIEKAIKFFR